MFPLTITIHTVDQLVAVMGALKLAAPVSADTPAEAPEVAAPAGKPTRTRAATPAAPAPTQPTAEVAAETVAPEKTVVESSPTAAPAEVAPQPSTAVDYPTLQKAVAKLFSKDRARCAAIPSEFGKSTYKELAPEQWAPALAAVEAALSA